MDLLSRLADRNKFCTGCGACANVCPKNAISLMPDGEGFLKPGISADLCVDCSLCAKTCPVMNPSYKNDAPECYAVKATDDLRLVSSSGGVFSVISEKVLAEGGVVFGAAWTDGWKVHIRAVQSVDDLDSLRRSKYVQSATEYSFREAKEALQAGKAVLFTGVPCQIAGLYAYLGGKSYDKLYTAEVICHGAPSPKALDKYLHEDHDFDKIVGIDFRNKKKVPSSGVTVYYENGKEYYASNKNDPFFSAFLPCMTVGKSCTVCPFSRLPRQADITMGDFWGANNYKKDMDDSKGLSAVLINNQKGRELISSVQDRFTLFEPVPLDAITAVNKTLIHPFSEHPGRKHFFSSLDVKPFDELVENGLNHHYDIGVVGLWYGINYGSILTYYALYSLLRDMGYDPVMLPRPDTLWKADAERFDAPDSIAQSFIWKHCNVFAGVSCNEENFVFNDLCKDFVLGSDVVWNYTVCGRDVDQFFFLDWVESGHKKIAFASSFGNGLKGPTDYVKNAVANLRKFDAISIREKDGVVQAKRQCKREDIVHVLDPVFLCDPKIYEQAIDEIEGETPRTDVFAYLIKRDTAPQIRQILAVAKECFGSDDYTICANPNTIEKMRAVFPEASDKAMSVNEWLSYMKHAKLFVGNSYHGLCFSLIFHVPFVISYNPNVKNTTKSRFESLLGIVGLEDRLLYNDISDEELAALIEKPIDWDAVEEKLNELRAFSKRWFREVLEREPEKPPFEKVMAEREKRKSLQRYVDLSRELRTTREQMTADMRAVQAQLAEALEAINRLERTRTTSRVKRGVRVIKNNGIRFACKRFWEKLRIRLGK